MSIIVIDPGHGGTIEIGGSSPNNATGPKGSMEKNLTLDIGLKTIDVLTAKQHRVSLTRSTDVNLGLKDRAQMAKDQKADLFISIHFNGLSDPKVQGTEVWVHRNGVNSSKLLAAAILKHLLIITGYKNRGVWAKGLGVLNPDYHYAQTAATLLEISFITDPNDEQRLQESKYHLQLAEAIGKGVEDYLNGNVTLPSIQIVPERQPASEICEDEDI